MDDNRTKSLSAALSQIEKQFGKGSIMRMGDTDVAEDIQAVSTGSLGLDIALGVGGLARGRVIEIYGPESSGKTTLTLKVIAEMQKRGKVAAFIDVEHALDPQWAKTIGVNIDKLICSQPDSGEEALEIVETLVRAEIVDVVVVDSVAALVPKKELEGDMGDSNVGLQARLMSQAMRKLNGCISKSKTTVIFINQIREKIGVMFGNPETTTGGRALKFFASVRVEIRRIDTIKEDDIEMANKTKIKVVKNKVAPPFRTAEYEIRFDTGIDSVKDILECAVLDKVIEKSGSWYEYNGVRNQGGIKMREYLLENPEVLEEIKLKLS